MGTGGGFLQGHSSTVTFRQRKGLRTRENIPKSLRALANLICAASRHLPWLYRGWDCEWSRQMWLAFLILALPVFVGLLTLGRTERPPERSRIFRAPT